MKIKELKAAVSYVCDKSAMYAPSFSSSFLRLKEINPLSAPHMGSCSLDTDERCIPLQMADLLAGECRIQGRHWLMNGNREPTPVIKRLKDGRALWRVRAYNEANLREVRTLSDNQVLASTSADLLNPEPEPLSGRDEE